jgi:hypothetical protein
MVAPALITAGRLALAAEKIYRRRDLLKPLSGEEDARAIIDAARDPDVPVEDVRLRARLRSRTFGEFHAIKRNRRCDELH